MFSHFPSKYLHPFYNTSIYLHMGDTLQRRQTVSKADTKQQGAVAVTGAPSGIGYATARHLAESGFIARRIPFRHLLFCACAVTLAIPLVGCGSATGKQQPSPAPVEVAACVPNPIRPSVGFTV